MKMHQQYEISNVTPAYNMASSFLKHNKLSSLTQIILEIMVRYEKSDFFNSKLYMHSTERPVLIRLKKRLKTQLTPWFCYENDYNLWKVRHFFRKTSQPDPLHHCHRCSGIFLQGEGGKILGWSVWKFLFWGEAGVTDMNQGWSQIFKGGCPLGVTGVK